MDNHFENNIEEINQIISRSKKDKSTTIFRIQKSKRLHVQQRNDQIIRCHIDTLEGVNMHMLSKDGQLIYGASDRMHLPDVITRLYQSLDNLLKANKGHKVRSEITIAPLPTEKISKLEYLDLAEWNTEYYQNIQAQIFSEIPNEIKDAAHVSFHIEGNHSLWLIANSEGGQSQFDDFTMTLTWKLALKSNPWKGITVTKLIPLEQLRSQQIDTTVFSRDIIESYAVLSAEFPAISKTEIDPELVLLNGELSSNFFYNLLRSNGTEPLKKEYKIHDKAETGLIQELVCKYGVQLSDVIEVSPDNGLGKNSGYFEYTDDDSETTTRVSRQYSFYDQVVPHFRNIVLSAKKQSDEPHLSIDIANIEESLKAVKKHLGVRSILYLAGIRSDSMKQFSDSHVLSPVVTLYSDEKGTYAIDMSHFRLPKNELAEIKFAGPVNQTVFRLDSQLPFIVENGNLCIIKSSKKFNIA
jgi:effector-binding domain-containing protein